MDDDGFREIKQLHKTSDSGVTIFKNIATKVNLTVVNGTIDI